MVQHQKDLIVSRDDLSLYYPHIIHIARSYPLNSITIGTLDLNDLVQSGHEGLIRAWDKVDWPRIKASPNPKGELWSFLKKRIRWSIRREIDKHSMHISTPINKLEDSRNKLTKSANYLDKTIVNIFPKFFSNINYEPLYNEGSSYLSLQLEELIVDELESCVKNYDHIDILLRFYGIGFNKMTTKELAEKYMCSSNYISLIINRTKNKLKTEEFEKKVENFYNNWI